MNKSEFQYSSRDIQAPDTRAVRISQPSHERTRRPERECSTPSQAHSHLIRPPPHAELITRVRRVRRTRTNDSTCVIHSSGGVTCWGWGAFEGPPRAVDGLRDVTAISIGGEFTCVVFAGGEVSCWSTYVDPITPRKMADLRDVVDVAMGFGTGCAIHRDGGVSCWGANNVGQVGDGTREARIEPVRLAGITDAIDVSLGRQTTEVTAHSCVLHRDGGVSCWGGNDRGQLGDGTGEHRSYPQRAGLFAPFPAAESPELDRDLLLAWIDHATGGHEAEFPWHWAAWDYTRHQ